MTTLLQHIIFGPLTQTEKKSVRESLILYLLFRLVFAGAILNPYDLRELVVWTTWFIICGTLRYIIGLTKERYTTLTTLATATEDTFKRYLILVGVITIFNLILGMWCTYEFYEIGFNILSLLLFENVFILFDAIRVIARYGLHLYGMIRNPDRIWDERGSYMFYSDFITEIAMQLTALAHLLHVWSFYGLSFTLIDLFLFMNLRSVGWTIINRCHAVIAYRRAAHEIETRYLDATPMELAAVDDNCAICRDRMDSAKKLPCGHLFHRSCLRQWIEYRRICPVCRAPLSAGPAAPSAPSAPPLVPAAVPAPVPVPAQNAPIIAPVDAMDDNDDVPHINTGIRRRVVAPAQQDNTSVAGQAPQTQAQAPLAGAVADIPNIAMTDAMGVPMQPQSVFRFSSQHWASWLPSFSFEVVRATGTAPVVNLDPDVDGFEAYIEPQQQQAQPSPRVATSLSTTNVTVQPVTMSATSSQPMTHPQHTQPSTLTAPVSVDDPQPQTANSDMMETEQQRRDRIWAATQKRLSGIGITTTSTSSTSSTSSTNSSGMSTPQEQKAP